MKGIIEMSFVCFIRFKQDTETEWVFSRKASPLLVKSPDHAEFPANDFIANPRVQLGQPAW